jgi:hypothetical protein
VHKPTEQTTLQLKQRKEPQAQATHTHNKDTTLTAQLRMVIHMAAVEARACADASGKQKSIFSKRRRTNGEGSTKSYFFYFFVRESIGLFQVLLRFKMLYVEVIVLSIEQQQSLLAPSVVLSMLASKLYLLYSDGVGWYLLRYPLEIFGLRGLHAANRF